VAVAADLAAAAAAAADGTHEVDGSTEPQSQPQLAAASVAEPASQPTTHNPDDALMMDVVSTVVHDRCCDVISSMLCSINPIQDWLAGS
jgi:hypothetical protein